MDFQGFKIDTIMNIRKDLTWSDLKPDGPDGLADVYKIPDKVTGIGDFLMEMCGNVVFEPYDALTVGGNVCERDVLPRFIGDEGYFFRSLRLNRVMLTEKTII